MTDRTPVCERCSRPIDSEDEREQPGADLWEHVGDCPPPVKAVTTRSASYPRDPEPTWDASWGDLYLAIGREFWKLAPDDFVAGRHCDLKFLVTWQDLMAAVDDAVASCYPGDGGES